uniref:hypothetical protein n=1 Tax=Clostridium paraputrificum TaxID=29363 RepID=UPI003BAD9C2C
MKKKTVRMVTLAVLSFLLIGCAKTEESSDKKIKLSLPFQRLQHSKMWGQTWLCLILPLMIKLFFMDTLDFLYMI